MGDRIVVMKDGFVQQVDSPQNLFFTCKSLCSRLYGSPQMNFVDAVLRKIDDRYTVEFGHLTQRPQEERNITLKFLKQRLTMLHFPNMSTRKLYLVSS